MDLAALRIANMTRQAEWCLDHLPSLSFRGNELAGEIGEVVEAVLALAAASGRASNPLKKLERERHGWAGSRASVQQLAAELADVVICADLVAIAAGIDLAAAIPLKFNATSVNVGLSTLLDLPPTKA